MSSLALFPLHIVLFPGGPLPLRIFETRYIDMVRNCMRAASSFGVVLIRAGDEVGPAETFDVGTTASIVDFHQLSDGLLGLSCCGGRRFRINTRDVQADGLNVAGIDWLPPEPALSIPERHAGLSQLLESVLPDSLPGHGADNAILANTLALQQKFRSARITLVSKDINLRIKAAILGVHAEDYSSDKTIEDADLLVSGVQQLPQNFWEKHGKGMESWQQQSRTYYRVRGPLVREWKTNQFVYDPGANGVEAIVRKLESESAILELTTDYRTERNNVWGVTARNREQNLALNLLMDPEIDFVTVLGPAGTGKTLLTLAAGLAQTLDHNRFSEIIMTRVTIPLGEDIGFLPGTEEEKMEPWMGALMDNLEVLTQSQPGGTWGRGATNDLLRHRIKIRSLNFMRGRTFLNRFIIIDEAQNLTPKQMKALVTRAGPGTKMVCLGNIAQIDTPYLTETTTGLTYVVNRFHGWAFSGHITLVRGERSRLADYASEVL